MEKLITFNSISIGELLTFISSIILLIITWKSVSNAKNANKITEQSLKLQSDQFNFSMKPDLTFEIPPIKYTEDDNNKLKIGRVIYPDHEFYVKNLSANICYNISVTTLIYMPDEGWEKYYSFLKNEFDKDKNIPNIDSHNAIHSLHTDNGLKCTIPFYYLILNIIAYDGTITSPDLYVLIKYEDKTKNVYEEWFELRTILSTIGNFNGPDDLEIKFRPRQVDDVKTKMKLDKQKKKLKDDFPNRGFYY